MKKLAIVTTHPIQYNAPVFRLLTERKKISIKVFYTWGKEVLKNKYDPGFGKVVNWDIPLLEGYDYVMVENVSRDPGTHHYKGIVNPNLPNDIMNWNPDCLLVIGWKHASHFNCMRYFKGNIPVFFWGDSTLTDQPGNIIKRIARKLILRWVYSYIDYAFYVGKESKKYFLKYGIKNQNLFFAPHAIDNDRFSKADRLLRLNLAVPDSAILFLFAGKWEAKKDPLLLLEAFVLLDHKDSYLLFVGNGEYEQSLRQRIHVLSPEIQNRIRLMPFQNQSEMPRVYQACDVFVLPSKGPGETWGLAVNEAMASGKAVIVSDKCGCHPDLVFQSENGFVFPHGNVNALLHIMKHFCDHKEFLKEMGNKSRVIISGWNFTSICEGLENAIEFNLHKEKQ